MNKVSTKHLHRTARNVQIIAVTYVVSITCTIVIGAMELI